MTLTWYFDHHVKREIAEGLRRRGIDVLTAFEDGSSRSDDETLLQRATALGRVLFTQDSDFLELAGEWQATGREYAGIVFCEQRTGIGQAVTDLELISQVLRTDEIRNRVEFIPL